MALRKDKWELGALVRKWAWELTLHRRWHHAGEWDAERYILEWIDDLDVCFLTLGKDDNNQEERNTLLNDTRFKDKLRNFYLDFCKLNQNDEPIEEIEAWIEDVYAFLHYTPRGPPYL